MKYTLFCMAIALSLVYSAPVDAEPVSPEEMRWAGAITGGVVIAGVTAFTAYIQFVPADEWTTTERIVTYIPMAASGIVSSFLSTIAFFDLFIETPMHPALAGLAGLGAGALEGAIVGGATIGSYLATATFFDRDYFDGSDSIYESGWIGLRGGALFGAMIGAIPGAIIGALIAILM